MVAGIREYDLMRAEPGSSLTIELAHAIEPKLVDQIAHHIFVPEVPNGAHVPGPWLFDEIGLVVLGGVVDEVPSVCGFRVSMWALKHENLRQTTDRLENATFRQGSQTFECFREL